MNTNNLNICLEWWGGTNRDLHWDDFVCCRNWNCLFPGLSLQSMSSWWQKMSFVKGTPLPKSIFWQMFFVSMLRAIRVTTDNREWQEKKTGIQYPGCYRSKTFDPLCSSMKNLHVCSISKCASIKEIVLQQRYVYQNLTESHINIKWQNTCLISGMKNCWHLISLLDWTLSSPQITQINFTVR